MSRSKNISEWIDIEEIESTPTRNLGRQQIWYMFGVTTPNNNMESDMISAQITPVNDLSMS